MIRETIDFNGPWNHSASDETVAYSDFKDYYINRAGSLVKDIGSLDNLFDKDNPVKSVTDFPVIRKGGTYSNVEYNGAGAGLTPASVSNSHNAYIEVDATNGLFAKYNVGYAYANRWNTFWLKSVTAGKTWYVSGSNLVEKTIGGATSNIKTVSGLSGVSDISLSLYYDGDDTLASVLIECIERDRVLFDSKYKYSTRVQWHH